MNKVYSVLVSLFCVVSFSQAKEGVFFLNEEEYKKLLIEEELAKKKAELELKKAAIKNKEDAYNFFKNGRELILDSQEEPFSDNFRSGLEKLHFAIKLDSTKAIYFATLGDAYNILGTNNMPSAKSISLNSYKKALEIDKSLNEVRIKAAMLCCRAALYKESLDYFEPALQNSDMYLRSEILDWMNIAYLYVPQTTRGVEFYTQLLEKYPNADILKIYKVILLKSSFRTQEAEDVLLELISSSNTSKETTDLAYGLLEKLEKNNEKN